MLSNWSAPFQCKSFCHAGLFTIDYIQNYVRLHDLQPPGSVLTVSTVWCVYEYLPAISIVFKFCNLQNQVIYIYLHIDIQMTSFLIVSKCKEY